MPHKVQVFYNLFQDQIKGFRGTREGQFGTAKQWQLLPHPRTVPMRIRRLDDAAIILHTLSLRCDDLSSEAL